TRSPQPGSTPKHIPMPVTKRYRAAVLRNQMFRSAARPRRAEPGGSTRRWPGQRRDPARQRTWIVLGDGAKHQPGPIRAGAPRRGVTISILIDLIHVLEYIWKAAWSLHPATDPAAEDWMAVKALAVLAGHSARVAAGITAEADAAGLTAD